MPRGMGRGVQDFRKLRAWQACDVYKKAVYRLCEQPPLAEDWKLRDQLRESVAAAPSQLAEGFGRFSPADFARFTVMARSSLMESQNHLHDAVDRKHISESIAADLNALATAALQEVTGLMEYLLSPDALRNARRARERRIATRHERRGQLDALSPRRPDDRANPDPPARPPTRPVRPDSCATQDAEGLRSNATHDALVQPGNAAPDAVVQRSRAAQDAVVQRSHATQDAVVQRAHATQDAVAQGSNATEDALVQRSNATQDASVQRANTTQDAVVQRAHATQDAVVQGSNATEDAALQRSDAAQDLGTQRTKNAEQRTTNLEPRTQNPEPRTQNRT